MFCLFISIWNELASTLLSSKQHLSCKTSFKSIQTESLKDSSNKSLIFATIRVFGQWCSFKCFCFSELTQRACDWQTMPHLLWDTASGCHGNCISCLGAPQAVASLAQCNITSHIFCVEQKRAHKQWVCEPQTLIRTIRSPEPSHVKLDAVEARVLLRLCVSQVVFAKQRRSRVGVHGGGGGGGGGGVPGLKVRWPCWCSQPAGSLLHQDVQPIEEQLGLLKWSLHSSGKSVFALRPKWAIVCSFATSGLVKALGWSFRGCSVNGLLSLCVPHKMQAPRGVF